MSSVSEQLTVGISSLVSVAGIWILFFWFWRDYRLDRFRQQLFEVRDELFDLARSGLLGFDHPAYGMLRTMLNGAIRYGHRLGFLDVLAFALSVRKDHLGQDAARAFEEHWKEAGSTLSPEALKRVNTLRNRLHYLMVQQVVFTSTTLMLTLLSVAIWAAVVYLGDRLRSVASRVLGETFLQAFAAEVDSAALALGSE